MRHATKALVALAIPAVLALYAGGYLLLVDRWDFLQPHRGGEAWIYPPKYRYGGAAAEWLFAPAHSVDIRLRPDYWLRHRYDERDHL